MDRSEDHANLDGRTLKGLDGLESNMGGTGAVDQMVGLGSALATDTMVDEIQSDVTVATDDLQMEAAPDGSAIGDQYTFVERRSKSWLEDRQATPDDSGAGGAVTDFPGADQAAEVAGLESHEPNEPEEVTWPELVADAEADFATSEAEQQMPEAGVAAADQDLDTDAAPADSGDPSRRSCRICEAVVSQINIEVDGNTLILESCDQCDARRWRLDGQPIDLQQALDEVGDHAGRRQ